MEYKIGKKSKNIETTVHKKEKRKNIPTEELRDFVAEDEAKPKTILYPRDPSLDPQLVWKGKDEQDRQDLAVPAVPVYIQEKIHPKYIIEDLRAQAKKDKPEMQIQLFADFNGLKFEEMVEFYQHEQSWANRMILGDSLLVMTSLAEKEGLKGKVQMIYIDPPYGIKFGSNWQVSTRKRDVKDGSAGDTTRQPEQIKAFRDTWKLGIHSYLAYLRDRLVVARDLLSETGSIFVQIGDENVHLVRLLLDEVFGSNNFVSLIPFAKTSGFSPIYLSNVCDIILWYGKNKDVLKYRQLYKEKIEGRGFDVYQWIELEDGTRRKLTKAEREDRSLIPATARLFRLSDICSQGVTKSEQDFKFQGQVYKPRPGTHWATTVEGLGRLGSVGRIMLSAGFPNYARFIDDYPVTPISNLWDDTATGSFTDEKIYVVQTGTKVI